MSSSKCSNRRHVFFSVYPIRGLFIFLQQYRRWNKHKTQRVNSTTLRSRCFLQSVPIGGMFSSASTQSKACLFFCNSAGDGINTKNIYTCRRSFSLTKTKAIKLSGAGQLNLSETKMFSSVSTHSAHTYSPIRSLFIFLQQCRRWNRGNYDGLLPDIILLTQCYYHRGTRSNAMKEILYLQPLIPPKRFDISPP